MKDFRPDRPDPQSLPGPAQWDWAGPELRSTLKFLLVPIVLGLLLQVLQIGLPSWGLKAFAMIYGLVLFARTMKGPESLLALTIIYVPLARLYPAAIAPGVNGSNVLVLMMLLALMMRSSRGEQLPVRSMPATTIVKLWLVLSVFSIVHATFIRGAGALIDALVYVRVWLDQFIIFFGFIYLIRDGAMARRLVVYMMLSTLVGLAFGFDEWLDKRDYSSIEKARLLGPQLQPNDFAAFLVIGVAPFIAFIVNNLTRWWVWGCVPFLLAFARVLLATFSRGAYIGFGVACFAVSYMRGKIFLTTIIASAFALFSVMPQLMPDALRDRVEQSTGGSFEDHLDASSETRLILWNAAIEMTLESPLFGKGYGMFPLLKEKYTAYSVPESDNHNMFLYISSQMGIPALLVFLAVFYRMYMFGVRLYRSGQDMAMRTIGLSAVAMVGGTLALNMFGSRMVDVAVMMHFWVMLAVLSHLWVEEEARTARVGVIGRQAPRPNDRGGRVSGSRDPAGTGTVARSRDALGRRT